MSDALKAWKASFVRRWHSSYDLCETLDYVSGHQGRVALLMLALKPDVSRVALIHAITHDQGEVATGDIPRDVKRILSPGCRDQLCYHEEEAVRGQFGELANLTVKEADLLRLCDWLDAWMWMMKHARHLWTREDWQKQKADTLLLAYRLDLDEEVGALIDGMETRA